MASATTPTASAATRQRSGGDSTSRVELVPNDRARVSGSHEPERPARALCFEAEGHARSGHRLPSCGESASAICETMPREHPPRRRDDDDTDQGGRLAAPTPGNCAAQESLLQSCDASQLESVASWKHGRHIVGRLVDMVPAIVVFCRLIPDGALQRGVREESGWRGTRGLRE